LRRINIVGVLIALFGISIIIFYSIMLIQAITSVNWFSFTEYTLPYLGISTYSASPYSNGAIIAGFLWAIFGIILMFTTEIKIPSVLLVVSSIGLMGMGVYNVDGQIFSIIFYFSLLLSVLFMSLAIYNEGIRDAIIGGAVVVMLVSVISIALGLMMGMNAIVELLIMYSCFVWWGWLALKII
jgi:hypothetical membrane protein